MLEIKWRIVRKIGGTFRVQEKPRTNLNTNKDEVDGREPDKPDVLIGELDEGFRGSADKVILYILADSYGLDVTYFNIGSDGNPAEVFATALLTR